MQKINEDSESSLHYDSRGKSIPSNSRQTSDGFQTADDRGTSLIKSPAIAGGRKYNREKYYSALKTGFKHMNPKENGMSFLKPPTEEALPALMPFVQSAKDGEPPKSSSMVIIFSCWNTMVGSAMVSLPWTY